MKWTTWPFRLVGRRVIKTALAVFLTSLICLWLGWPPVFAVITAIVTIEPTVSDSIKKGLVRFPASAIGSLYAVFFIYLFGDSPITYTLAAFFTIVTCFRLNLHDGLLVATLTSVAMIEVIHTNFLLSFLIRLGTTTIGLSVSTLVNMFILPPNYTKTILNNIHSMLKQTGEELEMIMKQMLENQQTDKVKDEIQHRFYSLKKSLDQTEVLLTFQSDEAKYHRIDAETTRMIERETAQLKDLRLIHYHIGNLVNTPVNAVCWNNKECRNIVKMVTTLTDVMKYPNHFTVEKHREQVTALMEQFWNSNQPAPVKENEEKPRFFTPEIIILYELLSIYQIVEDIIEKENLPTTNKKVRP